MSNNWQINDIALCIKQGKWRVRGSDEIVDDGPKAGQLLTVNRVDYIWNNQAPWLMLGFVGYGKDLFAADRFIRIAPGRTTDRQDLAEVSRGRRKVACSVMEQV